MLYIPQKGIGRVEDNFGAVGSVNIGTSVSTAGAATNKGTAVELIASTSFDAYGIRIIASGYGNAGNATQGALDILTGAATEKILIPNLLMGYCGGLITAGAGAGPKIWDFPLYIPSGTRIAAQVAGAVTSTAMRVAVQLYSAGSSPFIRCGSKVVTYGMGTMPNGTAITPGTNGAEGGWTQITASTSEDHWALIPSFQVTGDVSTTGSNLFVDIGLGAATEKEIGRSFIYNVDNGEKMGGPFTQMPIFRPIPSGSRLTMRASNSSASNDGGYNGVIHGVS